MKKLFAVFLICLFAISEGFSEESDNKEKITLTLEDAVSLAMQENVTIKRQTLALNLLKERAVFSWNSASPSLSLSGSYGKNLEGTNPATWSVSGAINIGLSANLYSSIKTSNLNYQNGLITYEQTKKSVELNVRKIFLNILLSRQSLELQKKNLETARQRYNSNREKFNRGQISELDLLNSQYTYESLKPAVETASINYENSLVSFKILLGLPAEQEIELKGNLKDYVSKKEIDYQLNIEEVPSVQALERQIESAKITLLSARFNAYGPTISAGYTYGVSGTVDSDVTRTQNQISLSVRIPLDGFMPWTSTAINVDSAKTSLEDLELQLENEKANTKLNIETSIKKIKQAQEQLKLLESNVELAQKTYNMTLTAYNHGSRDYLTLQNASVSLLNAQINLEQQRYNLIAAVLELENTLGLEFGELTK